MNVEKPCSRSSKSGSLRTMVSLINEGFSGPVARASRLETTSRAIGGISDSVLSDRLADLTEAGLIARTVDEGPPISVSYALTDRGSALIPALEQIALWSNEHLGQDDA